MIPKIIHYCWFGKKNKPKLARKCIASWREKCPDFEIVEWSEDNYDVNSHPFLSHCYQDRKWAFLSDMARLDIVYRHGGIYLDTDVELLRPLDDLLAYKAYFGFENPKYVATGLGFGAEAGNEIVGSMLEQYLVQKADANGQWHHQACPALNTQALLGYGLRLDGSRQHIMGAEILPVDFLNPYDDIYGTLRLTNHTISVHHYAKSWLPWYMVWRAFIGTIYRKTMKALSNTEHLQD